MSTDHWTRYDLPNEPNLHQHRWKKLMAGKIQKNLIFNLSVGQYFEQQNEVSLLFHNCYNIRLIVM